jgi:predicted metalloprotease with PDZ domain
MSALAPFVDAAAAIDRTNWDNTFISYYTFGAALGLALDLSLRIDSGAQRTLDTYMQAMWTRFGRPGQKLPGVVATTYTISDLRAVLAELASKPFADSFFDKYILGHDVVDYAALLANAGLAVRKRNAGRAYLVSSGMSFSGGGGARLTAPALFETALYKAGVDRDDLLVSIDGLNVTSQQLFDQALAKHKPGDQVPLRFVRRSGEMVETTVTFEEDPRIDVVTVESSGGTLTAAQKQFREQWLGSKVEGR